MWGNSFFIVVFTVCCDQARASFFCHFVPFWKGGKGQETSKNSAFCCMVIHFEPVWAFTFFSLSNMSWKWWQREETVMQNFILIFTCLKYEQYLTYFVSRMGKVTVSSLQDDPWLGVFLCGLCICDRVCISHIKLFNWFWWKRRAICDAPVPTALLVDCRPMHASLI